MFDLTGLTDDESAPIPTLVTTEGLSTLLVVVEYQVADTDFLTGQLDHSENSSFLAAMSQLSIKDKVELQELADRFDCVAISASVTSSLQEYYDNHTGLGLLAAASKANLVAVARVAIRKLGHDRGPHIEFLYRSWWDLLKDLRPTWQIELTRLAWVNQYELVDRPNRPRTQSGKRKARTRETVMVQTTSSWAEIAAAFDPPKVRDTLMKGYPANSEA